jgi:hypothetical protein
MNRETQLVYESTYPKTKCAMYDPGYFCVGTYE